MIKTLFKMIVVFIIVFIATSKITLVTAEAPQPIIVDAIETLHKSEYTKEDIINLIGLYAEKYQVDEFIIKQVVWHESHYNRYDIGDDGNAYGLVQINRIYHPNITKEQAQDPHFALDFLAKSIKNGQGRKWTGYRVCILNEKIIYRGNQIFCDRLTN